MADNVVSPSLALRDEVFKPVPELPGYCVSSQGRVFSSLRWGRWRQLARRWHRNHLVVTVFVGAGTEQRKVIDLVAAAFIGPCPDGHCTVASNRRRDQPFASNVSYITIHRAATFYGGGEGRGNFVVGAADVIGFRKRLHEATIAGGAFDWKAETVRMGCSIQNLKAIAKCHTWRRIDAGVPAWQPGRPLRERAPNQILDAAQVRSIKVRLMRGERVSQVARSYPNVSAGALYSIKSGNSWKHVVVNPAD